MTPSSPSERSGLGLTGGGRSRFMLPLALGAVVLLAGLVFWMWRPGASLAGFDDDEARMERLRRAGDVKALGELANDDNERVASLAVRALGRCGESAVDELRRLMADPRPRISAIAAVSLAKASPSAGGEALEEILANFADKVRKDPSTSVRVAAAQALGRMKAGEQIEALLDALNDRELAVRQAASAAIYRITNVDFRIPLDDKDAAARDNVIYRIHQRAKGIKDRARAARKRAKR